MNGIALIAAVLVAVFVLRFFLGRFFVQVGVKAITRQPDAIHLQRSASPAWRRN